MDYTKLSVAELKVIAKEKGIRNITGMKKSELAELLMNVDKVINKPVEKTKSEKTKSDKSKDKEKKAKKTSKDSGKAKSVKKKSEAKSDAVTVSQIDESQADPNLLPVAVAPQSPANVKNTKPIITETKSPVKAEMKTPARTNPGTMVYDGQEYNPADDSGSYANGILEVLSDGYGFLRSDNYMPGEKDIYISPLQIRRFRLKTGDIIKGPIKRKTQQNEKFSALLYIETVNGTFPSEIAKRKNFEEMTPIFPDERIKLDYPGAPISLRIVDLFSPIGKGQRGMIVSPPKAGKTTLLKQIAKRISVKYPEMNLLVLLIDERPEEVTDIKESIEGPNAEVIYSTFDELPEHHKRVSEMVIERAKRLVESGKDVVILIDSITRLSRAYNLTVPPSGRTLSGGLDPAALHMPKKFFGAARNMREGGSLTILATALIDTGSRMDDVVFEEFKGTGNMELVLDRNLSEKRVFPAIDISKSGTRKDDLLLTPEESEIMEIIHGRFHSLKTEDVTEDIVKLFKQTRTNTEFIEVARKLFANKR